MARLVDQSAGRCGHQHAGDAADGHDRADVAALPTVREQVDAEERPDAGLHIGHEEVQRKHGPRRDARYGIELVAGGLTLAPGGEPKTLHCMCLKEVSL